MPDGEGTCRQAKTFFRRDPLRVSRKSGTAWRTENRWTAFSQVLSAPPSPIAGTAPSRHEATWRKGASHLRARPHVRLQNRIRKGDCYAETRSVYQFFDPCPSGAHPAACAKARFPGRLFHAASLATRSASSGLTTSTLSPSPTRMSPGQMTWPPTLTGKLISPGPFL